MSQNINYKGMDTFISDFNDESYIYPYSVTFLSNCSGDAIGMINSCIAYFDQLGAAVDSLYASSAVYFTRVQKNYENVESNNLMELISDEDS
jgi:hypothetical protein